MTSAEIAELALGIGPSLKKLVDKTVADHLAPVLARNQALELRLLDLETRPAPVLPERGERGERGADGVTGAQGAPGEKGIDGAPGRDGAQGAVGLAGKDAPTVDIQDIVSRVSALVPAVKDGVAGPQGEPGLTGKDGAPGVNGKDGINGARGEPGAVGRDGNGIADLLLDRAGALVATFSDGRTKALGLVTGKDGEAGIAGRDVDMDAVKALVLGELAAWPRPKDGLNGVDGRDGLSLERADFLFDDARGFVLRLEAGEIVKEVLLPIPYDAGVWQPGKTYAQGAGATWSGGYWIAMKETSSQPGESNTDWRLAVR